MQGVFPADTADAVLEALGPRSCLVALWHTELSAGSMSAGPTELDAMSPACSNGVSRFPSAARIAAGDVADAAWLDVGVDAARALNVWTGSEVKVSVGPGIEPVVLTVRDIYAVRATGFAFTAMAPAQVLFAHLPTGVDPGYSIGLTDLLPTEIEARLAASPVRPELENAKGYPPIIVSERDLADSAAQLSMNSLGLVRTIGALAAIGVILIMLRELDVFRRGSQRTIQVVYRLGGNLLASVASAFAAATAVAVLAISGAIFLARLAYSGGVLASTFPPDLEPLVFFIWLGTVMSAVVLTALMARLTYRQTGI
ncbi:MAG: hypothetical protein HYX55_07535 [Chloroflexi bacterium]|nr:hypothetical protein [Chloroflexota bacterium]